jgi:hypothetical protein
MLNEKTAFRRSTLGDSGEAEDVKYADGHWHRMRMLEGRVGGFQRGDDRRGAITPDPRPVRRFEFCLSYNAAGHLDSRCGATAALFQTICRVWSAFA